MAKKEKLRKYYLTMTLKEVFAVFQEYHPHVKIGFTLFTTMRPVNVILMKDSPLDQCKCVIHENFRLKLHAIRVEVTDFWSKYICNSQNYNAKCWLNTCEECQNGKKLFDEANNSISDGSIHDSEDGVSWDEWKEIKRPSKKDAGKVISSVERTTNHGSLEDLKHTIHDDFATYQEHVRTKRLMDAAFQMDIKQENSVVMQVDFAMDYNCSHNQDEIQNAIYGRNSIRIFTCAVFRDELCKSYSIISDANKYKDSVCVFINKLVDMIWLKDKEHFIIYSDGPRAEFKNKFITGKLLYDLSIKLKRPVSWKYFATGHGKGVVDGIGGSTKARVKEQVIGKGKGKTPIKVENFNDFFELSAKTLPKITYLRVSKEEVEEYVNEHNPWEDTITLTGVSNMHVAYACSKSGVVKLWKSELDTNSDPNLTITYANTITLNEGIQSSSRRKRSAADTAEQDTGENNHIHPEIPIQESMAVPYLQMMWKRLMSDRDIIGKWYAALFYGRRKPVLYIGKVTNVIENGAIEMNWLKPAVGNATQLESIPMHLPQDKGIVAICDVIAGPLVVCHIKGNKWNVPNYVAVKRYVCFIEKINRTQILANCHSKDTL